MAVIAVALLSSGCIDLPNAINPGNPGGNQPTGAQGNGGSRTPDAGASATPASLGLAINLAECTAYVGLVNTERHIFQPDYPENVTPVHSTLVFASFTIFSCGEAALDVGVAAGFQLAVFVTLIDRPDGVSSGATPLFVHQAYSNSDFVRSEILNRTGWAIEPMETVQFERTPIGADGEMVSFAVPPGREDYEVKGLIGTASGRISDVSAYVFEGTGSIGYAVFEYTTLHQNTPAGRIVFGEESYWAAQSPFPAAAALMNYRPDMSGTLTFAA